MTKTILWSTSNVPALLLPGYESRCQNEGGTAQILREPDCCFTVNCIVSGSHESEIEVRDGKGQGKAWQDPLLPGRDLSHLHPVFRTVVEQVEQQLASEGIALRLCEGFRGPERQELLFSKGRNEPGKVVTHARAWESLHQFGLAADFDWLDNSTGQSTGNPGATGIEWDRFREIARQHGLEPLSWQPQHVQLSGWSTTQLTNGDYPPGGDTSWKANLRSAIRRWRGGRRPVPPGAAQARPAMAETGWRNRFGGSHWGCDSHGAYVADHRGQPVYRRSCGAPTTILEILSLHGPAIRAAARRYRVAPELVLMIIATECGDFRGAGYTGPPTFQSDPGRSPSDDPRAKQDGLGDYRAGPMRMWSDVARRMNTKYGLGFDNDLTFPTLSSLAHRGSGRLGLYDSDICIDVGTCYLHHNMRQTGEDPVLVAAAYAAGHLRPSATNHWHLACPGISLDRALEWYNDARFVLSTS